MPKKRRIPLGGGLGVGRGSARARIGVRPDPIDRIDPGTARHHKAGQCCDLVRNSRLTEEARRLGYTSIQDVLDHPIL